MPGLSAAPPLVLTIAGFDPTAGAGVGADIKAISANQCYALACVTALTIQNAQGTLGWQPVAAPLLKQQLAALRADFEPRAVKIGMLGSREVVEVVAQFLERHPPPWVVLDPVYQASAGAKLVQDDAWEHLKRRLLPLATVLTPNLDEAERLTGIAISRQAEMQEAAVMLHRLGVPNVVIKGGHLERPVDLLFDGTQCIPFAGDRVRVAATHGTGCTFSAALAANLALGKSVADAVLQAKAYLTAALRISYPIAENFGPVNHLFRLQEAPSSRNVDPAPSHQHTTR